MGSPGWIDIENSGIFKHAPRSQPGSSRHICSNRPTCFNDHNSIIQSSSHIPALPRSKRLPVLALNSIKSGVIGNYNLVFERPSAYPGTPAYLVNSELAFIIQGETEPYAVNFGDSIRGPGDLNDVMAGYGFNQAVKGLGFSGEGYLVYANGAQLNFFACNTTLNGVEQFSLKTGFPNEDGSAPAGCVAAQIRKPTAA
ncbi:hypothetical protein DL98DRAFT_529801 [Cadophora sp. DSE1049]|nr:hypothetical protein DL98DRAFT_529801 [Cadophora sp. DSE1049]